MKPKKVYRCYYCGNIANTREHAPPKIFFPNSLRDNLVTVPSCSLHNNAKSNSDEYIFQLIVSCCEPNQDEGIFSYQVNKVKSSFLDMNMGKQAPTLFNMFGKRHKELKLEVTKDLLLTFSAEINYKALDDFSVSLAKALIFHKTEKIIKSDNIVIPHAHAEENSKLLEISNGLISTRANQKLWDCSREPIFKFHIDEREDIFIVDMIFYGQYNISCVLKNCEII
jgi:hypothetical protein